MKFVTSFSPHRIERQQYCLSTWMKYGLPVVAVQSPGEADKLRSYFPSVEFVETDQTGESLGRPHLPLVSEMCKQAYNSSIILINSDISIKDTYEQFNSQWKSSIKELVVGIRTDYNVLSGEKRITPWGIDVFKIEPDMLPLENIGLCIGFPGWDYWLPWELSRRGYRIRTAKSSLLHSTHKLGWSLEDSATGRSILEKTYNVQSYTIAVFLRAVTGRQPKKKKKKKGKV